MICIGNIFYENFYEIIDNFKEWKLDIDQELKYYILVINFIIFWICYGINIRSPFKTLPLKLN